MKFITIDNVLYLVKTSDVKELESHVNSLCGSYTIEGNWEFQKAMDKVMMNCYFRFDWNRIIKNNFIYGHPISVLSLPESYLEAKFNHDPF